MTTNNFRDSFPNQWTVFEIIVCDLLPNFAIFFWPTGEFRHFFFTKRMNDYRDFSHDPLKNFSIFSMQLTCEIRDSFFSSDQLIIFETDFFSGLMISNNFPCKIWTNLRLLNFMIFFWPIVKIWFLILRHIDQILLFSRVWLKFVCDFYRDQQMNSEKFFLRFIQEFIDSFLRPIDEIYRINTILFYVTKEQISRDFFSTTDYRIFAIVYWPIGEFHNFILRHIDLIDFFPFRFFLENVTIFTSDLTRYFSVINW